MSSCNETPVRPMVWWWMKLGCRSLTGGIHQIIPDIPQTFHHLYKRPTWSRRGLLVVGDCTLANPKCALLPGPMKSGVCRIAHLPRLDKVTVWLLRYSDPESAGGGSATGARSISRLGLSGDISNPNLSLPTSSEENPRLLVRYLVWSSTKY